MDETLLEALRSQFPYAVVRKSVDDPAVSIPVDASLSFFKELKDTHAFDMLMDVTAADWDTKGGNPARFTVFYHFFSSRTHKRLRIAIDCPDSTKPEVPSLTSLWPAADWHEREVYDMFGIQFSGHPDLRRILMWEDYPHFPLRKEFPLAGIEEKLPAADVAEATGAKVDAAPMMGGPFVATQSEGVMSRSEPRAPSGGSYSDDVQSQQDQGLATSIPPQRSQVSEDPTTEVTMGDIAARSTQYADEIKSETMTLNVGPSHPTTHGVLRLILNLDGDRVTRCEPVIGYLHRGDEKIAENMTYNQFIPYTDRLDYLAPLANNVAYVLAVEKLAQLAVPPRCAAIRVLVSELARISSHLLGLGVYAMDVGAWTPFMYCFTEREKLYTLFEALTGARFTTSYTRIGGVARDVPEGWLGRVNSFCNGVLPVIDEIHTLLTRNKIFLKRTEGIGVITQEMALAYGLTGPNLRATGIDLDLRKDHPYSGYEQYDFDVPIGTQGDSYDRYLVRMEEVRQSVRIVRQVIENFPDGPWYAEEAKKIFPPPKEKVLTSMEELIQNFMLVTEGPQMPPGEVYFEAENPKGALGFFIVSKGGGVPYRLKIRGPSFCNLSILSNLLPEHYLTDITVILGSLDFVMGECDR